MVNEEDHLRIQCLLSGLQPNQAYRYADDIDDSLEKVLITHLATNEDT